MRILLGASDPAQRDAIVSALARHEIEVETRVEPFVQRASSEVFDLVLAADVERTPAVTLASRLPARAPIIVVTRVGDVEARVRALEAGADDAFDAAFAPSQMMARATAAVRKAARVPKTERIEADGTVLDLAAGRATREGRSEPLTAREIELVRWLHGHRGRIVSRAELLENVWGVSPENATRAVDVAIAALRAKIERDPRAPAIIVSVKGAGYRWDA